MEDGNYRRPAHKGSADGVRTQDEAREPRRLGEGYGSGKGKSTPRPISPARLEFQKKLLEEELAKPRAQRIGKLRALKAGDFTPAELAEFERRYKR